MGRLSADLSIARWQLAMPCSAIVDQACHYTCFLCFCVPGGSAGGQTRERLAHGVLPSAVGFSFQQSYIFASCLAGGSAGGQTRERLPDGSIAKYTQAPSVPGAVRSASSGGSSSSRIPADLLNGRPELPPGDGRAASPTSAFFMRSVTNPGGEGLAEGSRDEDDYDEGRRESVKSKNRRHANKPTIVDGTMILIVGLLNCYHAMHVALVAVICGLTAWSAPF